MNKQKIFITRNIGQEALDILNPEYDLDIWKKDTPPPYEILMQKAGIIDGIVTMLTDPIDRNFILKSVPKLKVISQMAVGFDNIDVKTATENKIPVGNTPGVLTETTADFTWALLLSIARRVTEANAEVHHGIWKPWGPFVFTGREIYGSSLGIIGFGRIGQAVAKRAMGFNMKIYYRGPRRNEVAEKMTGAEYLPLDDLLAASDFITLHTYLSPSTYHLINADTLKKVKTGAVIINTARGGIIDLDALLSALQSGKVAAAALDVTEPEPIPADHRLLSMPNVIITPHIASSSQQTRKKMATMVAENVMAGLKSEPLPYCVNPEIYRT